VGSTSGAHDCSIIVWVDSKGSNESLGTLIHGDPALIQPKYFEWGSATKDTSLAEQKDGFKGVITEDLLALGENAGPVRGLITGGKTRDPWSVEFRDFLIRESTDKGVIPSILWGPSKIYGKGIAVIMNSPEKEVHLAPGEGHDSPITSLHEMVEKFDQGDIQPGDFTWTPDGKLHSHQEVNDAFLASKQNSLTTKPQNSSK
jgi:hypothetical protein